jgi:hypothetical protein
VVAGTFAVFSGEKCGLGTAMPVSLDESGARQSLTIRASMIKPNMAAINAHGMLNRENRLNIRGIMILQYAIARI